MLIRWFHSSRGPRLRNAVTPRLRMLMVFAIVLAGLYGNVACGGSSLSPVYQVSGARLTPWNGRVLADDEVRQIVVRAATMKNWQIQSEQPGVVFARTVAGSHEATVRIDYNGAGYSISYVESSPGLRYDGQNIHRRYNNWVRQLDEAIQREFSIYEKLPAAAASGSEAPAQEPAPQPVPPPVEPPSEAPAPAPGGGLAPVAPPQ